MATTSGIVKGTPVAITGAELMAHAMRQTNPDVVACYPITPQTVITEAFSEFVARGEVQTEFVAVESEHAAMSACVGASAAGARAQTATAGPGLALMFEILYVASGNRLPIVMHLATRSFSAPINILCDHSDAMAMRDSGWVMLIAEGAQEAYDNGIMCTRIAEHPDVMLPVANLLDGFIITHAVERSEMLPDDVVAKFVGSYKAPLPLLDVDKPVTYGPIDFHDFYFDHKRQQIEAMTNSKEVIKQVSAEFGELTGRNYDLLETYRMEDAEIATVVMGSSASTVRETVDWLRKDGIKAGMVKVRCYRPFPTEELGELLKPLKGVSVLERATGFGGASNPLTEEVGYVLHTYDIGSRLRSYVYGLGGKDTTPVLFRRAYEDLLSPKEKDSGPEPIGYLGIEE
jgi:pyruvate ferredoxin oxidoreductase alpha subunit